MFKLVCIEYVRYYIMDKAITKVKSSDNQDIGKIESITSKYHSNKRRNGIQKILFYS